MIVWASEVSVVVHVPLGGSVPRVDAAPPLLSLPVTGADAVALVAAACVLIALGVVLVWMCRRAQA